MKRGLLLVVSVAFAVQACGPSNGDGDEGDETGTTASGDDGTTDDDGTSGDGGTGSDGGSDSATNNESSDSGDGGAFIEELDGGSGDCDIWAQDCPDGEKCAPWASNHDYWDATKCVPLDPNPKQPGDPCTIEESLASGVDDCDVASMCFPMDISDTETLQGVCVAFCTGSPQEPACEDPTTACGIYNDGVLPLCLPRCDPLLQDCPEGQGCYIGPETFNCAWDGSEPGMGDPGDPCEFVNVCHPGLCCINADSVAGCQGSLGCCSPFCDTTAPNTCPGMADGEECVPYWAEGEGPPEYEHVGVCALP